MNPSFKWRTLAGRFSLGHISSWKIEHWTHFYFLFFFIHLAYWFNRLQYSCNVVLLIIQSQPHISANTPKRGLNTLEVSMWQNPVKPVSDGINNLQLYINTGTLTTKKIIVGTQITQPDHGVIQMTLMHQEKNTVTFHIAVRIENKQLHILICFILWSLLHMTL